jgi:hypothetical protein
VTHASARDGAHSLVGAVAAFAITAALIGCGRSEDQAAPRLATGSRQSLPSPPAVGNFPPEEGTRIAGASNPFSQGAGGVEGGSARAALILEHFRVDLTTCAQLIELLRADPRLTDQLEKIIAQPNGDLDRALRGTRAFEHNEIRTLIANREFVHLKWSRHGDPYAAAVLENRAMTCAPTRARFQEIEQLGPSVPAWTVREYFLTGTLRALRMPWSPAVGVDFESLRDELEGATRIYRGPLRERLETWLGNAANVLRREQNLAESTPDGQTAEQHRDAVGEWIVLIESLRSIRIESTGR